MEIPVQGASAPAHIAPGFGETSATARPASVRFIAALASLVCSAAGLALAAHYPIGSSLAAPAIFVAVAACTWAWTNVWLVALPAAIPLVGFAPWTGWITFEELDMLALAIAAGGYARLARRQRSPQAEKGAGEKVPIPLLTWLFLAMFVLSLCVSFFRGVADAGGFSFGWFEGYQAPMNSVRLGKSFFLVLLLLPLWREAQRASPRSSAAYWTTGLCLGLAGASAAALWERMAFTGLLDFSTDYRTTALFWEMHVGGAALDGFLALTVPFAIRGLQVAGKGWRWMAAVALLLLASYACLTTFSRGLFLAIPAGLATMIWFAFRQRRAAPITAPPRFAAFGQAACFAVAYVTAAFWIFPSGGYRALLALLGTLALLMRLGGGWHGSEPPRGFPTVVLGIALSVLAAGLAWLLPKGAYLAYLAAFVFVASMSVVPRTRWLALAGYVALVTSIGLVCLHWGGEPALTHVLPVMAALLLAAVGTVRAHDAWPSSLRWQGTLMAGLIALSAAVGILSGGAYMTDRMSTSEEDLQGRVDHWIEGVGVLHSPDQWAFGMGLGRYPANYFLLHSGTDAPGDYALSGPPGDRYLVLSGGEHMIGWGELLRVSQRLRPPQEPVTAALMVRVDQPATLHLEVCEKHLLYSGGCLLKEVELASTGAAWKAVRTPLDGIGVSRGWWLAPRLLAFSIGNATKGTHFQVRDLRLIDADGTDLLANGDFSRGMARWFFSSDRNHLPWHLKNLFVHVLFDQGGFGLAVFILMLAGSLWRLGFGSARHHPLAPAIAGAIVGFIVVGLFDSLVDVPRDAFVFYFLLLQGLTLRSPRSA